MRGWLWLQGLNGEGRVETGAHVLVAAAACQTTWACYSCTLGCAWFATGSVPRGGMYSSRGHIGHGRGNRHLRLGWTVFSGAPCDIGVGYKLVDKLLAAHLADDILGRKETKQRALEERGDRERREWRGPFPLSTILPTCPNFTHLILSMSTFFTPLNSCLTISSVSSSLP